MVDCWYGLILMNCAERKVKRALTFTGIRLAFVEGYVNISMIHCVMIGMLATKFSWGTL